MATRLPVKAHLIALVGAFLLACNGGADSELKPAQLEVSTELLEFGKVSQGGNLTKTVTLSNPGEVTLGILSIGLSSDEDHELGHQEAFEVTWNPADLVVPSGSNQRGKSRARPNETAGETSFETADTSAPPIDTGDPDKGEDGYFLLTLPPGSWIPISVTFSPSVASDNYDSLVIRTADEEDSTQPAAERVYRDVDNTWRLVYLHGEGDERAANILVSPRSVDFGHVWPGQTRSQYVTVRNIGDGPLRFNSVSLVSTDCAPGFSIVSSPIGGTDIEGDGSTVIEFGFSPEEEGEAFCRATVSSQDQDAPDLEVTLRANTGKNPANTAPVVEIFSPEAGHVHHGWAGLTMEIRVFDVDQPANTLSCKVKSSLQLGAYLSSCTPSSESGHVLVSVPTDLLSPGPDVLTVQVTDASEVIRKASIPVLINAAFPADDDDGDGFSETAEENPDCDDTEIATHPLAAELFDGKDNDCDFFVDEETDGADDDGDGLSEMEGDCDDNDAATYPGAPEQQDQADNDCDGVIDEGTSAFDDDEDGFSELDMDCDDSDPAVNPSSPELCGDGLDNNCNGLKDSQEPCLSVDSTPMIVGGIQLSHTSIEVGESVLASVLVYEGDGDVVSHQWEVMNNAGTFDDASSAAVTWTAPDSLSGISSSQGGIFRLSYVGTDDDDNQVWVFQEVRVYPRGSLNRPIAASNSKGCQSVSLSPSVLLLLFVAPLIILGRRKRRVA